MAIQYNCEITFILLPAGQLALVTNLRSQNITPTRCLYRAVCVSTNLHSSPKKIRACTNLTNCDFFLEKSRPFVIGTITFSVGNLISLLLCLRTFFIKERTQPSFQR